VGHRDLHGNGRLTAGGLSGIVDWGLACAGDPAVDVQVVWSPLFDDRSRALFVDALGVDDDTLARSRGAAINQACAALPYYLETYPLIVERSWHKLAQLGVVLLLFELHHLAFYALFGAVGSLAAAVVALFVPSAVGLQAGVAVGLAVVGVVAVRPLVSNAFAHRRGGHVARGVHGGLIGQQAVTLDTVGGAQLVGHVLLAGGLW